MEGPTSTANCPGDSVARPVSGMWGLWWVRVLLFIAHLALLVAAASLTPADYFFQLGTVAGWVVFPGTLLLWLLLWVARERTTVLLFCGLVLAQTGFTAFVAMQFRAEDRILREMSAESAQLQAALTTQMANFHLERVLEMLTPGNEFHPEELPGLLEHARAANVKNREQRAQEEAWANEAEKRLAVVSQRAAADFRRGFENGRDRSDRIQKLNGDYITRVENLVIFIIDNKGRYRVTRVGPAFDRPQDADAYNQLLHSLNASLNAMLEDINAARRSNSQP